MNCSDLMNPAEVAAIASAIGIAIAKGYNGSQNAIIAAVLAQIADTVATISTQQIIIQDCYSDQEKSDSNSGSSDSTSTDSDATQSANSNSST